MIQSGWVRVAVEAASCAGPELSRLDAARPLAAGGAGVGRVVAAGEGAAHLESRRVLFGAIQACGECDVCRRARPHACPSRVELGATAPGALGGEVLARARWVLPMGAPLDIPGPLAALVPREAADAYALFARAGAGAGDVLAILGRGPVATLLRALARARGAREAHGVTPLDPVSDGRGGLTGSSPEASYPGSAGSARAGDRPAGGEEAEPGVVLVADGAELGEGLAHPAAPGAARVFLARGNRADGPVARVPALLAEGGALLGVPAAHPDLYAEVAALAVKGDLDLALAADVEPLGDRADLPARIRASLARGRALVVTF